MPRAGEAGLTPEQINARRTQALALRRRGKSYTEIAEALGVSRNQAYDDVVGTIRRQAAEFKEGVDEAREVELTRLDRILDLLWDRIEAGSLDHMDTYFKTAGLRAKLIGLYAAGKSEVTIKDGRPEHTPDAELHARVRLLQERLAKLPGAVPHPMLSERNPFTVDADGTIVGEVVKVVAPTGQNPESKLPILTVTVQETGERGGSGAADAAPDGGGSDVGDVQ